jgi:hypothetical protein
MAEGRGTVRLERPGRPLSGPVRDACEATDWDATAVLDVVTYAPATSLGFEGDRQRIETARYGDRAPPLSTYENGERSVRVTRLTRPLWERLR